MKSSGNGKAARSPTSSSDYLPNLHSNLGRGGNADNNRSGDKSSLEKRSWDKLCNFGGNAA